MSDNLFVSGFPYEVTEADLKKFFSACGAVTHVKILTDRDTGRSRGLAFVNMSTEAEAQAAIAQLNGTMLGARTLYVEAARPPHKPVQRTQGGYADKPGFVERRSGKDRRQNPWTPPAAAGAPGAPAPAPAPLDRREAPPARPDFAAKKWEKRTGGFGGPKKWDKKPGGFGGPKKWDKKPGEFGGPKKWDKKPGEFGGPKKWDKKPGEFGGPKKWGKKPGGFGGKKPFFKGGGFRKGPRT